jgi:hypothetical protein
MATRAFDFQKMLGSRTGPTASDWADVLAGLPLFARISKRRLRKIASLSQIQQFSPGDIVVQVGEPADAFYLILAGRARVVGKSRRTLGIGDYFGENGAYRRGAAICHDRRRRRTRNDEARPPPIPQAPQAGGPDRDVDDGRACGSNPKPRKTPIL